MRSNRWMPLVASLSAAGFGVVLAGWARTGLTLLGMSVVAAGLGLWFDRGGSDAL